MAFAYSGAGALDYLPCHYGASRLVFRGPRRRLDLPYVVALGGTETYGKFVRDPWPALAETLTGLRMVNFGCANAGADVYLADNDVMALVAGARLTVVQIMGAVNLSNRFYAVHPRRNDRFLRASPALMTLYPEVDFTNFHFTRHLLQTLQAVSPARFEGVADELRANWVDRMGELLRQIAGRSVLLWMATQPPPQPGLADLTAEPLLVDLAMVTLLREAAAGYCEVIFSPAAQEEGPETMVFGPLDGPAARGLPGPLAHAEVADALADVLDRLL